MNKPKNSRRNEKSFQCSICQTVFTKKIELKRHMHTHDNYNHFQCDICGQTFNKKFNFRRHYNIHTNEKPHICKICGQRFRWPSFLQEHENKHLMNKLFICQYCNETFTHRTTLRNHNLTHTGEKPHRCEICDKRFSKNYNLKMHRRLHTGDLPFQCDHCDRSFNTKSNLKNHLYSHTGIFPFICDICHDGFRKKNQLLVHYDMHLKSQDICGIASSSALMQHQKPDFHDSGISLTVTNCDIQERDKKPVGCSLKYSNSSQQKKNCKIQVSKSICDNVVLLNNHSTERLQHSSSFMLSLSANSRVKNKQNNLTQKIAENEIPIKKYISDTQDFIPAQSNMKTSVSNQSQSYKMKKHLPIAIKTEPISDEEPFQDHEPTGKAINMPSERYPDKTQRKSRQCKSIKSLTSSQSKYLCPTKKQIPIATKTEPISDDESSEEKGHVPIVKALNISSKNNWNKTQFKPEQRKNVNLLTNRQSQPLYPPKNQLPIAIKTEPVSEEEPSPEVEQDSIEKIVNDSHESHQNKVLTTTVLKQILETSHQMSFINPQNEIDDAIHISLTVNDMLSSKEFFDEYPKSHQTDVDFKKTNICLDATNSLEKSAQETLVNNELRKYLVQKKVMQNLVCIEKNDLNSSLIQLQMEKHEITMKTEQLSDKELLATETVSTDDKSRMKESVKEMISKPAVYDSTSLQLQLRKHSDIVKKTEIYSEKITTVEGEKKPVEVVSDNSQALLSNKTDKNDFTSTRMYPNIVPEMSPTKKTGHQIIYLRNTHTPLVVQKSSMIPIVTDTSSQSKKSTGIVIKTNLPANGSLTISKSQPQINRRVIKKITNYASASEEMSLKTYPMCMLKERSNASPETTTSESLSLKDSNSEVIRKPLRYVTLSSSSKNNKNNIIANKNECNYNVDESTSRTVRSSRPQILVMKTHKDVEQLQNVPICKRKTSVSQQDSAKGREHSLISKTNNKSM